MVRRYTPRTRPYCVRWELSYPKRAQPPIIGLFPLWPNGWMDQDSRRQRHLMGRYASAQATLCYTRTQLPPKGGIAAPTFRPICGSNGWMDQDAIWYGDRPIGPGHIVLDGDSATQPQKGTAALSFRPMSIVAKRLEPAWWIKMPPGREVGLGPGHIVKYGDPAPPHGKGHSSP